MNRADVAAFACEASSEIGNVFGQAATWKEKEYCIALTGVTQRRPMEDGGFAIQPDFMGRVSLAAHPDFAPALGDLITVNGRAYKVVEKTEIALSRELRIGLGKA